MDVRVRPTTKGRWATVGGGGDETAGPIVRGLLIIEADGPAAGSSFQGSYQWAMPATNPRLEGGGQ